jgi:hypothetical protein
LAFCKRHEAFLACQRGASNQARLADIAMLCKNRGA